MLQYYILYTECHKTADWQPAYCITRINTPIRKWLISVPARSGHVLGRSGFTRRCVLIAAFFRFVVTVDCDVVTTAQNRGGEKE